MTEATTPVSLHHRGEEHKHDGIAPHSFLEVTLNIFASEGIHQVTLSRVARETGGDQTQLNAWYENVEELIEQAFLHYVRHRRSALDAFWKAVDERQSRLVVRGIDEDQAAQHRLCEWVFFFRSELSRLINQHRQELKVEMTLLLTRPHSQAAQDVMQQIYQALFGLCRRLNQSDAEVKAQQLLNAILSLTYAEAGSKTDIALSERFQLKLLQLFRPLFVG